MREAQIGPWLIQQIKGVCYVDGEVSANNFDETFAILMDRLNDPLDMAARVIGYKHIQPDGSIKSYSVSWKRGTKDIRLDGCGFSVQDLEAIVTWIKQFDDAVPIQEARNDCRKIDRVRELLAVDCRQKVNPNEYERGYEDGRAALAQEILEILEAA